MTDDTAVRELMRTYTDGEPPMGFGIDDVHRAASGGGSGSLPGSAARRRWVAPLVAAAACTALVAGGAALVATRQESGAAAPTGGGYASVTPTPAPSVTPSPIPTITQTIDPGAPVTGAQMPDLLRSIAVSVVGAEALERRLVASTWTFNRNSSDGVTVVPLARAKQATHWSGAWGFDGGKRRLNIDAAVLATDVTQAEHESGPVCRPGRATADTCGEWTLADGSVVRESYTDAVFIEEDSRVSHALYVRTRTHVVAVRETHSVEQAPVDITQGWALANATLETVIKDERLRFEAPDPLPPFPSSDYCGVFENVTKTQCQLLPDAG